MNLEEVALKAVDIQKIEQDWTTVIEGDENISPDKYFSLLSYFHQILSDTNRVSDENENLFFSLNDENDYAQGLIHIIHARKKSDENGWLKVQSTRLNPELDLYSSSYDELKYHDKAANIYAKTIVSVISLAEKLNTRLVKYYCGGKDKDLVFSVARAVNNDKFNSGLGLSSEAKGAWVHITLN